MYKDVHSEAARMPLAFTQQRVFPKEKHVSHSCTWMYTNDEGGAEDRLLERQFSRSRFLTVREKHRRRIPAAECFRQVQAGSRSAGGDFPPPKEMERGPVF